MDHGHCDCWIGPRTGGLINLYSAYAHWRLLFGGFRCCGCCAATAGTPQLVSSLIHFHATLVESRHWLVDHAVSPPYCQRPWLRVINLYAVPESSSLIIKGVWFESLLTTNCDYGRHNDFFAVWDAVPELPGAARSLSEPLELFR